jgi:acetoin utilization deacetylase AcuC-like enzyme
LSNILTEFYPDIIFYLAGVDVVSGDRFGKLALSEKGLFERDYYVLSTAYSNQIPIVLLASGGYAQTAARTAELHLIAYHAAREIFS